MPRADMTSYNLDIESFLTQIRQYPELWDVHCEDYKYRHRRQRAWDNIAKMFINDFDDMRDYEKEDVYKKLHGKWRNLRDSYVRHMKKGSTKSYTYGKLLTFLNSVYSLGSEGDDPARVSDAEDDKPLRKPKKKRTKDRDPWAVDEEVPSILENFPRPGSDGGKGDETLSGIEYVDTRLPEVSCTYNTSNEDEDRSFFDSLLPAVRQFNLDQKLEFRSQIISVVRNIRNSSKRKDSDT